MSGTENNEKLDLLQTYESSIIQEAQSTSTCGVY